MDAKDRFIADKENVKKMYAAGSSIKEITEKYKVNANFVSRYLKLVGIVVVRRWRPWNRVTDEKIIELYNRGLYIDEIASTAHMRCDTLQIRLKKLKINFRSRIRKNRRMKKSEEVQVIELVEAGWKQQEIAEKLGFSQQAIGRCARRNGIRKHWTISALQKLESNS